MSVSIEKFGKDHWSTFGYVACRVVSHDGIPDRAHMRCDHDQHPGLYFSHGLVPQKYPTILKGGDELKDHDDYDCVDDLEAAGLVSTHGTGVHPIWKLTDLGWEFHKALTLFKNEGGSFADFGQSTEPRK